MKIKFTKMHGCKNDYIYFNLFNNYATGENPLPDPSALAIKLSDRNSGIGGDGIVLIMPSDTADAKMRMFNIDGSEGRMCGNAIRCVAKYLYENDIVKKETITIETLSGIKTLELFLENDFVKTVRVNMGKAIFNPALIPVKLDGEEIVDRAVDIDGASYNITCLSMGNPHAVIFGFDDMEDLSTVAVESLGKPIENAAIFPEKTNVEFIKVISPTKLLMRVWERGSGETKACGTGACAAVAAAVKLGFCKKDTDVSVSLLGGDLTIRYTDKTVFMTGGCVKVFDGEVLI